MSTQRISKDYMKLLERFPLRQIINNKQLRDALALFNTLLLSDNENKLSKDERDYMFVLGNLIKEFEGRTTTVTDISPADALRFLMKENGLSQSDLVPFVGYKSNLSAFLSGKRNLSKDAARKLGQRFKVDPILFLPRL